MTEAQQIQFKLMEEIFGDGTLTVQEARRRVFGNVVIDADTDYGKNRWFTETGNFRKNCAEHLGILPPYPNRVTPVKCGTGKPPEDFLLPEDDRLADFIIDNRAWNYPALLAELEVLNQQKFWVSQAKNMLKDKQLSDLVAQPLEHYSADLFRFCVKSVLSQTQATTKKMLEECKQITPSVVQIVFDYLTTEQDYIYEDSNKDFQYVPTSEGKVLGLGYSYLEPHNFGKVQYHEISKQEARAIKRALKDNPERYYVSDTLLSALAALDFAKTFGKVPNKASLQRLGKQSS